MQNIKLNSNTNIDLAKLIDSRLLVQANSGGGKSWLLRRLLEQSHGKVQQIVIDLEGEFSTLREKYDYILAGKGGDTPADPRSAALLAKKLLELNVSAIIDLYELNHFDRKRFVKLFLEAMVNAPKELWHPCLVIVDEAHVFCPEKGSAESSEAVIDMATRGRKRGYCVVLATQRLSKLHKDAAAECNNKLIGRTSLDVDMKRAADELGFSGKGEDYMSLRKLEAGEFFAFGPAISNEVIKIPIGQIETTHPKAGSRFKLTAIPPTAKIKALLPKLSDLPLEAKKEAQTTADLKAENAQLRRELTIANKKPGNSVVKIEKIEVPTIGKRTLKGLLEIQAGYKKFLKQSKDFMEFSQKNFDKFFKEMEKINYPMISYETTKLPIPLSIPQKTVSKSDIIETKTIEANANLTRPEQKILDAVVWLESIGVDEPEQTAVAFLAGYTFGGGAFNNPKGSLRQKGLIEYRSNKIVSTDVGRQMAAMPEAPLTTDYLHKKVLDVLPGPEQRLLKPLLEAYPQDLSYEEVAQAAGYMPTGGAFNNPKSRLRSLGLVEYVGQGRIKARDILFI